jgi:hypothetical protein
MEYSEKKCLTLCLCRLKQSLNITADRKVLYYEFGCDIMECVEADKTHFLKFCLMIWQHLISDTMIWQHLISDTMIWQHLISGTMLENEKVEILIALMTKLKTLGAGRQLFVL